MAKYTVRTSQFCAISRETKWQAWLQTVSQELAEDLIKFLKTSNSCNANHDKMMEIYRALSKKNMLPQMIKFLKKEYPHAIDEVKEKGADVPVLVSTKTITTPMVTEVFKHYNPSLLSFPQKIIFQNTDVEELRREVSRFLVGKIGGDYLIVKDTAYVEYFKLKYGKEASGFPPTMRELVRYRAKKGLLPGATIIQENIGMEKKDDPKVQSQKIG